MHNTESKDRIVFRLACEREIMSCDKEQCFVFAEGVFCRRVMTSKKMD